MVLFFGAGFFATVFLTADFFATGFFVDLAIGLGVGFVVAAHVVPIDAIIAPAMIIESTRPFILDSI